MREKREKERQAREKERKERWTQDFIGVNDLL